MAALLLKQRLILGMKTKLQPCRQGRFTRSAAFTLTEALVSMAVAGTMFVALYAGMASSTFAVRLARENLRATQVMLEKMEVMRLLTWDQITSSNILPSTFTAPYYPTTGATNQSTNGVVYRGTIQVQNFSPTNKVYSTNIKRITVNVNWSSGSLPRSRTLTTYVARYGIENYIFN